MPIRPSGDYRWDGAVWVFDPPPEPTIEEIRAAMPAITRRQLRLALLTQGGIALSTVEAAINAIPDETERQIAQIEWNDATEFERLHPTLLRIVEALSLTPDQVDALWRHAATL